MPRTGGNRQGGRRRTLNGSKGRLGVKENEESKRKGGRVKTEDDAPWLQRVL